MKGLTSLVLGVFGTFAFSWIGLTVIPNAQIGHLDPQVSADDENDIYPQPPSGMAVRGRQVSTGNGCMYCHSEQVRPDYAGADIERKWGERRSAPRDYIFARPVSLGKLRLGPDLSNIGQRAPNEEEGAASPSPSPGSSASPSAAGSAPAPGPAAGASPAAAASAAASPAPPAASPSPSASPQAKPGEPAPYSVAWHHKHLYSPRSVSPDSNMPAYRFLYEKRRISGQRSEEALTLTGKDTPPDGYEIVPKNDAKCLVAYLMSLNQTHPLPEVKTGGGGGGGASPAASPAAAGSAAPAGSPAAPKK